MQRVTDISGNTFPVLVYWYLLSTHFMEKLTSAKNAAPACMQEYVSCLMSSVTVIKTEILHERLAESFSRAQVMFSVIEREKILFAVYVDFKWFFFAYVSFLLGRLFRDTELGVYVTCFITVS